jgi:gamma-glutamyltranspeptidase/glutathione hydrolase
MGHNSAAAIQLIVEAERRAYADRSYFRWSWFCENSIKSIDGRNYLKQRMSSFNTDKATFPLT